MRITIGILSLCAVGLAFLGSLAGAKAEYYTFVALCMMITNVWGGILLIRTK